MIILYYVILYCISHITFYIDLKAASQRNAVSKKLVKTVTASKKEPQCYIILLGRLERFDLITWVSCPSVRQSIKSFSDSDEIWYVGRGR